MRSNPRKIINRVVSTYTLCVRAVAQGEHSWRGFLRSQRWLPVTDDSPSKLQVFQLLRDQDPSGVSGVGRVAVGVVFPSGKVVLEWLGSYSTFGIYDDLGQSNTFTATAARLESFSLVLLCYKN